MRGTPELLLLTWTAGTLDGLSYLGGHVFTANMTGNTVLLGLHLMRGETGPAIHCVMALAAFAAGCALAAVFEPHKVANPQSLRNLTIAARVEFPLIAICSALWIVQKQSGAGTLAIPAIVLAAIALGIQSVAVRRLRISGVVTTFITGTITTTVVGLAGAIRSRERTGAWPAEVSRSAVLFSMFLLYLAAAVVAGYFAFHRPFIAAVLPLPSLVPIMLRSN